MRSIIVFLFLTTLFFSCVKDSEPTFTQEELQRKVDSAYQERLILLKKQAAEDYKNRLPIELKIKKDSLLNIQYEIPQIPVLNNSDFSEEDSFSDSLQK